MRWWEKFGAFRKVFSKNADISTLITETANPYHFTRGTQESYDDKRTALELGED